MGEDGREATVHEGMTVTVFDEDLDEDGNRDDLTATGIVERPPDWLRCKGSRWVLRVDSNGVRHDSDFRK